MFILNLKIALRNLFKNRVYALINIGGLAIGLTAFTLLLLYINYEKSYDSWSPDLKNVYQIRERHDFSTPDNKEHWQDINDSRVASLVKETQPQVIATTRVDAEWGFNNGYAVVTGHQDPILLKQIKDADSGFFQVFPYQFLEGNAGSALNKPKSIVLKQNTAIQLFGTTNVLGKVIKVVRWRDDAGENLTVTGVVREAGTPESVSFKAIMRTGENDKDPVGPSSSHYCQVFVRLGNTVDLAAFNQSLHQVYVNFKKVSFAKRKINFNDYYKDGKSPGLMAMPLAKVHYNPPFKTGWVDGIKPILGIAVFLLLVSIINFINLATAQSAQRAKEVGIKKALGSFRKDLIFQFLTESALQCFLSLFLTLILVEALLPEFNRQFSLSVTFWHNIALPGILLQLASLFVLVTLIAGFYPAWVLSNSNPATVLRGNYEKSFKGIGLRNGLVVFQFIIAVTFIIVLGVMHLQIKFMKNKDLGFERSNLINIRSNYEQSFATKLARIPGVRYVATTTQVLGNTFNVPQKVNYKQEDFDINTVTVTMDALPALGVKVLQGRLFSSAYARDTLDAIILNEAAAKLMGKLKIGEACSITSDDGKTNAFQVIGIIKNYQNEGFDKVVLPTLYKITRLGGSAITSNLLVRFDTENSREIIKKITAEWKKTYPDYPMSYETLDGSLDKLLSDHNRFLHMIIFFSAVSVSLSLLGLFSLSAFLAKRRTKEIAIRKILGATNFQLINMLNSSFLVLVLLANLCSWPIAYVINKKWLEGFAYRIEMPLMPFLLATILSLVITILTVSIQAKRAAASNPVDSLKYE